MITLKFRLLLLPVFCSLACAECLPIEGDRILGRDLARANPQFAALPATLTVGFAPAPGMTRIFAAAELDRIAKANGIAAGEPQEACFRIPMRRLTMADATSAMLRSLPTGASVAILEMSTSDVPVGETDFPLAGLESTAGPNQLWHGSIKFASTKKSPVWARVTVSQEIRVVVTDRDLTPNMPIDAASIRVAAWTGPLLRERVALRLEDVVGHMPKKPVKAGSPIPVALLDLTPSVRRGESVQVEVNSGLAHVSFQAVASRDSRDGDLVEFRNPATGRTFLARVAGSKAVVLVGGATGL